MPKSGGGSSLAERCVAAAADTLKACGIGPASGATAAGSWDRIPGGRPTVNRAPAGTLSVRASDLNGSKSPALSSPLQRCDPTAPRPLRPAWRPPPPPRFPAPQRAGRRGEACPISTG